MMEFLDLSVPVAGSGKFIQLYQTGALQIAQPIWAKYCRLQEKLEAVQAKRSSCNEAGWLFRFENKCRQQGKNFGNELRLLVDGLEKSQALLEMQCEKLYSQLGAIDLSLAHAARRLVGVQLPYERRESSFAAGKSRIDVLKRNWVIETNPSLGPGELCKRFDFENIPMPEKWIETFPEIASWEVAYTNDILRNRIDKMISETRRKLRLR
jgi:hypothetical protein